MKYLSDYTEQPITDAFNKFGAFFAFSDKQFNEAKKEGVVYASLGAGLICPTKHCKELIETMDNISSEGIKQDIKENGLEKIVARELRNYECYYTGEIDDCIAPLERYNVSEEYIWEVFNKNVSKHF